MSSVSSFKSMTGGVCLTPASEIVFVNLVITSSVSPLHNSFICSVASFYALIFFSLISLFLVLSSLPLVPCSSSFIKRRITSSLRLVFSALICLPCSASDPGIYVGGPLDGLSMPNSFKSLFS